jgi:hypothetical protein
MPLYNINFVLYYDISDGHFLYVSQVQVFSEYFDLPCQSSCHQFLHNHHHLSSEAGTIGQ